MNVNIIKTLSVVVIFFCNSAYALEKIFPGPSVIEIADFTVRPSIDSGKFIVNIHNCNQCPMTLTGDEISNVVIDGVPQALDNLEYGKMYESHSIGYDKESNYVFGIILR